MALTAYQQWWVRAGGNQLNGGGYDSTVSGAGTNYADQDSSQVSLTDLASTGAGAVVTSATGSFTSAMVGNIMRIASGTNFTAGYYCIVTYTSATQVTVDRSCCTGAGSGGVFRIGGAHASIINYTNGGTNTAPTIATPLAAGHIVNIRGAGSNDKSNSTPDYDFTGGYWQLPAGGSAGAIVFKGYNGRPCIKVDGLHLYNMSYVALLNLKYFCSAANNPANGILDGCYLVNCKFDQAGFDMILAMAQLSIGCEYTNTGGGTAGSQPALLAKGYSPRCIGNYIHGVRGNGIQGGPSTGTNGIILNNVIDGCLGTTGSLIFGNNNSDIGGVIANNTINGGAGDALQINTNYQQLQSCPVFNNIFSNHAGSGKYGINVNFGSAAASALHTILSGLFDLNNFYNNTAARNNINAGANDVALDPGYTNAGAGDFTVGTNMKAIGYPGLIPPI